ncbi:hypothetical protein SAMN02745196_02216 [Clostridium collagenovorans DSM 3089]|uniref:Uncharacterized protein n=1 Tax=Clostridium collagenovorans DSM 3089 TaxID=1121306 RepID=A0A1M5XG29_9CLOT|nr:hypothetical protein [Clostridium collagenovorans]SHH98699.1 hypothetical protein SAMN02745196_02216 [Clostridium collagenovorans DSM 3089]
MEILNQEVNNTEVGGTVACIVGCGSLCFISYGSVTAMALALIAL